MIDLAKNQHFGEIVDKGIAIYEKIKGNYEPQYKGKFLAIDVTSGKAYMADTGGEAIEKAKAENPEILFYLVRIGFDSVATLLNSFKGI
jgi:hypothetical protein